MFDIPGVVYPKEVLIPKAGMNRKSGRPYRITPGWGVTSREAASILGCTPSSARTWLHRRKVPFRLASDDGQIIRLFWRRDRVVALAESRLPIVQKCPPSLISAVDALRILHIGRSSLHRYQERGRLSVTQVRSPSHKGLRKCNYFIRSEIEDLAKQLSIMRRKETEISGIRRTPCSVPARSASPPPEPLSHHTRKHPSTRPRKKKCD